MTGHTKTLRINQARHTDIALSVLSSLKENFKQRSSPTNKEPVAQTPFTRTRASQATTQSHLLTVTLQVQELTRLTSNSTKRLKTPPLSRPSPTQRNKQCLGEFSRQIQPQPRRPYGQGFEVLCLLRATRTMIEEEVTVTVTVAVKRWQKTAALGGCFRHRLHQSPNQRVWLISWIRPLERAFGGAVAWC
jgi:hypothetical protein